MQFTKNIYNLQALNFMRCTNLRVGILGGTFDPAHAGHKMISLQALNYYKFDYIIWLVANQNPLKAKSRDIFDRANEAVKIADHPKIIVSSAEYDLGSSYIYDSLKSLIDKFPMVDFSWLMGIDSAASFGKWHRHEEIKSLCDIIIFDRPTPTRLVNSRAFGLKSKATLDKTQTNSIMIHRKGLCDISSTQIRNI